MNKQLYIKSYVQFSQQTARFNGVELNIEKNESLSGFAKNIYNYLNLSYPKFYKMDNMSKFGLLAAEFLFKDESHHPNVSLIFANKSSSLDTDIIYHKSIESSTAFFPSPSIFVYTLPNIVLGEICIKHKIQGENMFFILDNFDANTYIETVSLQYRLNKADTFILSWIEVFKDKLNVFSCYLTDKEEKNCLILNLDNLNTLFKTHANGTNN